MIFRIRFPGRSPGVQLDAVTADRSAFEISEEVMPRVLALLRLLAERALTRYGEIAVSKKHKQPRPLLTVHGWTYEIGIGRPPLLVQQPDGGQVNSRVHQQRWAVKSYDSR
ncbi:hypothetical protein AQI95_02605 [Streptomyces yokosukanensis]|uniref:Uncharacterized protein n=1 Tax=Streptomyces yokosukanensis TaxID=67386 RepID=A0A101PEB6_9ACTN|nr:hypothetical protein [Streptomyces yokosukanensis]KUN09874.1 hypothetical protein AQI95_02605 [Streptomyces yokosukanensis]